MPPSIELIIFNTANVIGAILLLAVGIFVLARAPKKTLNRVFFLYNISGSIYFVAELFATNISNPILSMKIFFLVIVTIFTVVFTAHWVLAMVGKVQSQKYVLIAFYAIATGMTIFFAFNLNLFLLPSHPLAYLPNFATYGKYFNVANDFFGIVLIYFTYHLIKGYIHGDPAFKNRIKYIAIGLVFGYVVSLGPLLVSLGLIKDPIMSALFPLYIIPIAYGIISEDLMDVRVVAKKALSYVLLILVIGGVFSGLIYIGVYLDNHIPDFPVWTISLVFAIITLLIARFIWKRLKESEEIKYGFIKVITHNFRTPLTEIKWSLASLKDATTDEERGKALGITEEALRRLSELTDVLFGAADSENKDKMYNFKSIEVSPFMDKVVQTLKKEMDEKKINLTIAPSVGINILVDEKKLSFAMESIVHNAVTYTPAGGSVTISIVPSGKKVRIGVKDTGIGIKKENLPGVFNNFYRTNEAFGANTSGVGLNLFIAKNIIEQEGGHISVSSDGEGKGAEFVVEVVRG